MAAEKSEQNAIRLTPELLERLRVDAERNERTVAQTVRRAVHLYLEAFSEP